MQSFNDFKTSRKSDPASKPIRALLFGLALFPCSFAAVLGVCYYFGFVDKDKFLVPVFSHRVLSAIIVVVVILVLLCVSRLLSKAGKRNSLKLNLKEDAVIAALLFVFALSLRLVHNYYVGVHVKPFSDFLWAYEAAQGSQERFFHYALFPSWGFYAQALGWFLQMTDGDYTSVQVLNIFLQSFSVVMLFTLAKLLSDDSSIAFCSAVFFALYPENICYSELLSPETPSVFLITISLVLLVLSLRIDGLRKRVCLLLLAGVLLAVSDMLKPISVLVIAAFAAVLVGRFVSERRAVICRVESSDSCKRIGRAAFVIVLPLVLIMAAYVPVKCIAVYEVEAWLGSSTTNSAPHYLFVGLAHDGEGQIHLGERNHADYAIYKSNGYDFEESNRAVWEMVAEEVAGHATEIPVLLAQKSVWAWQSDVAAMRCSQHFSDDPHADSMLASVGQLAYVVMLVLACVGLVVLAKSQAILEHAKLEGWVFIALFVAGFVAVLLIGEAQSRYKVMITPFIMLFSAYGFSILSACAAFLKRVGGNKSFPLSGKSEV